MVDHILVAVRADDDSARDALALGADLAGALGAQLHAGGVWVDPPTIGDDGHRWELDRWMSQTVDAAIADLPGGVTVDARTLGAPSVNRGLRRLVDIVDADLLVFGPSHLGRIGRALRGDVALHALQDAPCAIAAAPPGYRTGRRLEGKEVAVAWDGSDEALTALERAVELASAIGGAVRVLHVLETPYRWAESADLDPEGQVRWRVSQRPGAMNLLEAGRAAAGNRVPVTAELLEGAPGEELARATRGAAAVFAGSRSHGALERVALGSTSAELLHCASAPVIITPRTRSRSHDPAGIEA